MKPSTGWKELASEGEGAQFERYAQELAAVQASSAREGEVRRALHNKQHVGVRAELEVLPDLPEHARQGLFKEPKSFKAYVRFSNGDPRRRSDRKPDVRGLAIKVLGVPGKKVIPGMEDATTQDFLMIPSRTLAFHDAHEFMAFFRFAQNPLTLVPRMMGSFGVFRAVHILGSFAKSAKAPPSLVALPYFTAAPIQFGPYAARLAVVPRRAADAAASGASPDFLREELSARLRSEKLVFDVRAQFYVDDEKTPIEDYAVDWNDTDSPFIDIARLTLLSQDPDLEEGRRLSRFVDELSFDPWHALVEHKPLGNVMRARNVAYRVSTSARKAAKEPDGTEKP